MKAGLKTLHFSGSQELILPQFDIYFGMFTAGTFTTLTINGIIGFLVDPHDIGTYMQANFGATTSGGGYIGSGWSFWIAVPEGDPNPFSSATYAEFGGDPVVIDIFSESGYQKQTATAVILGDPSLNFSFAIVSNYVGSEIPINAGAPLFVDIDPAVLQSDLKLILGQQITSNLVLTGTDSSIQILNPYFRVGGLVHVSTFDFITMQTTNYVT